jgi:hypothetical protein
MRYAVVIEKGERNYSAYVPDLPGNSGDSLLNPHLLLSSPSQALHMHNPVRQIRMHADDVGETPVGADDGVAPESRGRRNARREPWRPRRRGVRGQ